MQSPYRELKAKYKLNKYIFVSCCLEIIEATSDGLLARIGIREPGDTVIAVGTRLYLSSNAVRNEQGNPAYEIYHVTVQGVEMAEGQPLLVCSPIAKETRNETRTVVRKPTRFDVHFEEIPETPLSAISGSIGGLTLLAHPSRLFVGLVLDKQYTLCAKYRNRPLSIPVQVKHLLYDWHSNEHALGVKVLELNDDQEFMLQRLIDPNYTEEEKEKAAVDTEEFRIRPENLE